MKDINIAVVSDSHDNSDNLAKVVAFANERKCEYLFHLGDIVSPFTARKLIDFKGIVKAVYGNCDGDLLNLKQVFNTMGGDIEKPPFSFELESKSFILMHEPYLLDAVIKSQEADFIFYGHLHKVDVRKEGRTVVINPGESGGWMRKPHFFIVNIITGEAEQIDL